MTHDPQRASHAPVTDDPVFDGAVPEAPHGHDAPAAYRRIAQAIETRRGLDEIPRLVAQLDWESLVDFRYDQLAKLIAIAPGDLVLDVAEAMREPADSAVALAVEARSPVKPDRLRRYVSTLGGPALASITGDTFEAMKKRLGGKALDAVPSLPVVMEYLTGHAGFVRWLVKTTEPAVCAQILINAASQQLATTLNTEKLWTPWIDRIAMAHGSAGLNLLYQFAEPDDVKHKLRAAIGAFADVAEADRPGYRKDHTHDLEHLLAGAPTLSALLEAVGDAGVVDPSLEPAIVEKLRALGASADDVLALVQAVMMLPERALDLLVAARGVTPHHIQTYLMQRPDALDLLSDAALARRVHDRAGQLRLQDIINRGVTSGHAAIVHSEILRSWYLAKASPDELLWFCGATTEGAVAGCRFVAARLGWKWVRELTLASDHAELSRLAIYCGEPDVAKYVDETLLGAISGGATVVGARDPAFETHAGQGGRLVDAVTAPGGDVLARLADLDPAQRTRLGTSDTWLHAIAAAIAPEQWARAALLLDLSVRGTIAASPAPQRTTVAYLHGRPPAEQLEALAQPACVTRAASHVDPDLLLVFPVLSDPKHLAAALERMPDLLELLVAGSDPSQVVRLLDREPARARAELVLEDRPDLLFKLPSFKRLDRNAQRAMHDLGKRAAGDGIAKQKIEDYEDGALRPDAAADSAAKKLHDADDKIRLTSAIDEIELHRGSEASLRAVLVSHRTQVPALLADAANQPYVDTIARMTGLPPHVVFPAIGVDRLLAFPTTRQWYFGYSDAAVLLQLLAGHAAARAQVAAALGAGDAAAGAWLAHLPDAAPRLTDQEDLALDQLQPAVTDLAAMQQLFKLRFSVMPPSTYDVASIQGLYNVMARLPRSHVQQGRIEQMIERPIAGGDGMWWHDQVHLTTGLRAGQKTDAFYPHGDGADWVPRADIQKLFGLDDRALAAKIADGSMEHKIDKGTELYRVAEIHPDRFTAVVLHEIGHQVDEILGSRTEAIYGIAGWREYSEADFDTWAGEMGGWDKVAAADKPRIREAWFDARKSGTAVKDLVDDKHPAMAATYAGVGIVDAARSGDEIGPQSPKLIGDRGFMVGPSFWSLGAAAVKTAPSRYSLNAPAEYFAECYVDYYRGVEPATGQATGQGSGNKGGNLTAAMKQWFDAHVDTLRYDPHRFTGKGDGGEGA